MFKQFIGFITGDSKPATYADKSNNVSFCESCGEVCSTACRSEAIYERVKEKSSSLQTGGVLRF